MSFSSPGGGHDRPRNGDSSISPCVTVMGPRDDDEEDDDEDKDEDEGMLSEAVDGAEGDDRVKLFPLGFVKAEESVFFNGVGLFTKPPSTSAPLPFPFPLIPLLPVVVVLLVLLLV